MFDFDGHFKSIEKQHDRQMRAMERQMRWKRLEGLASGFYRLCLLAVAGGAVFLAGRLMGVW